MTLVVARAVNERPVLNEATTRNRPTRLEKDTPNKDQNWATNKRKYPKPNEESTLESLVVRGG